MGYTPASCDNNCKGCQMNEAGWCTWKDRATPYYKTISYTYQTGYVNYTTNNEI